MNMKKLMKVMVVLMVALSISVAFAADEVKKAGAQEAPVWKYKVKKLDRAQLDALFAKPEKLLVLDVRRPDELTAKGGFPAYLSIQAKEVENNLAYIPRDRIIVTVSNRAHRAGDVGDLLVSKGYKVAGAVGVLDYEDEGGKLTKIAVPPPKPDSVKK